MATQVSLPPLSNPFSPASSPRSPVSASGEPANFIVFKQEVSEAAFVQYTQARSDDLVFPDLRCIRYDSEKRAIGVVEMAHPSHEAAYMNVVEQIALQQDKMSLQARIVPFGAPTMIKTPEGVMGRPDMCWGPADSLGEPASPLSNVAYPTLVLEVAYQESWADAVRDMRDWLGKHTHVQVVMLIKIFEPTQREKAQEAVRMQAALYRRGLVAPIPVTPVIQFGTVHRTSESQPSCITGPGQATIDIPISALYVNSGSMMLQGLIPLPGENGTSAQESHHHTQESAKSNSNGNVQASKDKSKDIVIDLFEIQQAVLRCL